MKVKKRLLSPDRLNDYLKATNIVTWLLLGVVIVCLLGVFVWSFIANITYKIEGNATFNGGVLTLEIEDNRKEELKVGQVIYISDQEGKITDIDDNGMPVIADINLSDGNYEYTIVIKTIHPIEFLYNR